MLIDTHCHLNHGKLQRDAAACLHRASAAGVGAFVVVGWDLRSSEEAVRLSRAYPGRVAASAGVHPCDAAEWNGDAARRLSALAAGGSLAAIGEIGLDYYRDRAPRDAQRAALEAQLDIASDAGLPVIFHCREAYGDLLDALEARGALRGVMHCWAGGAGDADRALALGLHLGFGGVITYPSAEAVRDAARRCPLDRLLLETDAPYLTPAPHRGKRNEPAFVALVRDAVAAARGADPSEIEQATTENALGLFAGLGGDP